MKINPKADIRSIWIKALFVIFIFFIIAFAFMTVTKKRFDKQMKAYWKRLQQEHGREIFHPEMVRDLPEPARRYFLHAIKPGTPLAGSVEIEMEGKIGLTSGEDKTDFTARQVISASREFIWNAHVGKDIMNVSGYDFYADKNGGMRWWLWGIIPLIMADDPETIRSAAGRAALETSIMLPSAMLPFYGVRWEGIDKNTARASLNVDDEHLAIDITVTPEGKLSRIRMMRWDPKGFTGIPEYVPWVGDNFTQEKTFQGYTIPVRARAVSKAGTDQENAFFEAVFLKASFQ
jgi:hypothetical protein